MFTAKKSTFLFVIPYVKVFAFVYLGKSKQFLSSPFTTKIPSSGKSLTYLINAFFTFSKVLK